MIRPLRDRWAGSLTDGLNRWSVDAVLVAVLWQWIFVTGFCRRQPRPGEFLSLAGCVWLIYVADRLLDARRLDLARPHTARHRFVYDHATLLTVLWALVLAGTVAVVLWCLDAAVIRGGLVVASAVLAYGVIVHSPRRSARLQSWKELAVGSLFAVGVSLVVWVERRSSVAGWPLVVATCCAAILFTANCVLVAAGEREQDRQQGFSSFAQTRPAASRPLLAASWLVMPIAVVLGAAGQMPARVAVALTAAVPVMLGPLVWRAAVRRGSAGRRKPVRVEPDPNSDAQTWWDTALWLVPAATVWWWG